jgi:MFS family permease
MFTCRPPVPYAFVAHLGGDDSILERARRCPARLTPLDPGAAIYPEPTLAAADNRLIAFAVPRIWKESTSMGASNDLDPSKREGSGYAWVIVAIGALCLFGAVGMGRFAYGMVLPSMQESLGMNNTQAGALATANLVGYVALSAIGGALATRFGPRTVVTMGMLMAGVGMLLTGLAGTVLAASVWRTVTGLGSGAVNVPMMGLVPSWFPRSRRGLATGVVIAGASAGLIVAGPVVPRILQAYGDDGWRVCWYIFGGVTLVLAIAAFLLLRDRPGHASLSSPTDRPAPGARTGLTAGLNWGRVYRSPAVWHLGAVYLAYGFSYIIFMTFFAKRLITDGGLSKQYAGSLFMLVGWLSLFCGVIWGAFSDRFGRKPALVTVYTIQALSFALFAVSVSRATFIASAVLFGITAWSTPAIMAATCGDALGPRLAPAALGLITLFFGIGQAVGPTVAGIMADAASSFAPAFWLATGVAALGAVGAATLRPASTGAVRGKGAEEPAGATRSREE